MVLWFLWIKNIEIWQIILKKQASQIIICSILQNASQYIKVKPVLAFFLLINQYINI